MVIAAFRLTSISRIPGEEIDPDSDSGVVTRPLSAFLRLAMMGCPARSLLPIFRQKKDTSLGLPQKKDNCTNRRMFVK